VSSVRRFVFAAEDARRLAGLRIALFGLLAIRLATNGDYAQVADQPAALFDPVSLFHLLSSAPSSGLTTVIQALAVVAALCAAAGAYPRVSFPTAFALALFLGLMLNATGKIVHNDVLLMLCLLPLLAAPSAASRAWSLKSRREGSAAPALLDPAYGSPIRLAMIIVGLAYLLAGLQKLRFSGLDWVTGDNLRYVLLSASDSQAAPNQLGLLIAEHEPLFNLFAAGALVVELGFILCLPFAKLRWVLVPAAVGLHAGIWLTMDLDYLSQALTVVVVFVNWAWIAEALRPESRLWPPRPGRRTPI